MRVIATDYVAAVLDHFDGVVEKAPGKWRCLCPAHADRNPSLEITLTDDGKLLAKCWTGCTFKAITEAARLPQSAWFPPRDAYRPHHGNGNGKPKPKAKAHPTLQAAIDAADWAIKKDNPDAAFAETWEYHDAKGQVAFVVARWNLPKRKEDKKAKKEFRPFHRAADGWRISDPPGKLPLFGLPELVAADPSIPVYVVEGEGKARLLRSFGFVVTCSAHGAEGSQKTDWTPLADRIVILLPDADQAGEAYAAAVAALVCALSHAARVKILRLPGLEPGSGDDVKEFVGHRREDGKDDDAIRTEIQALERSTPEDQPPPLGGAPSAHPQENDSQSSVWSDPKPIPDGLLPVMPFDFSVLPTAFVEFVSDVSERMQCPPDFPAVAMMIVEAGVVGKKIGIRPKRHDDWTVVANLWGCVLGRPGIMKSPAIAQPMKFLRRLEDAAKGDFEGMLRVYKDRLAVAEIHAKQRKSAIERAIKMGEDAHEAANKIPIETPAEPRRRRYLMNDSTVQKTGELLNENPNGLTLFRDEVTGFLECLDRDGQEGARAFYLEAWDGTGKFTFDRIGRGTLDIESVTLSVLGGAQPGKFNSYLQAALHGGTGDDGLVQRFQLLVYPDVNKAWRNIDRWPDSEARQKAWTVFERLDTLNPAGIQAECFEGEIPFLRFEHDAQSVFDEWRSDLERKIRSGQDHPAIESHLAKYRSLVPSVALLVHLADGDGGPVPLSALRKAIAWAVYLESHARRVYGAAIDPAASGAKALAKRIKDGQVKDGFALRDIYRRHWSGLSNRETVEPAVYLLADLGWLKECEEQTEGRTRTFFRINPAVCLGNGQPGQ